MVGRRTGGVKVSIRSFYVFKCVHFGALYLSFSNIYYLLSQFLSSPGAYPNFERSYIGNNIKLEIPHFSIWHRIQAPSHRKG
jgi:hypothetical protein